MKSFGHHNKKSMKVASKLTISILDIEQKIVVTYEDNF